LVEDQAASGHPFAPVPRHRLAPVPPPLPRCGTPTAVLIRQHLALASTHVRSGPGSGRLGALWS